MRFEQLDLSDEVLDALYDMHFDECTPIQEKAIPVVLSGRDLIACAQTGTGKTAAYLLPMISRLYTDQAPTDAINCVIMAPTRELAQQIDMQMEGFSYFLPISSVAVYGGTDGKTFAQQQRGLKLGADVIIATPGRLLAHLQMGYVDLSKVSFFILDEADRMLDMGFYDDIMQVVKHLPQSRQTLMFSATMPPKIQKMAAKILHDPVQVKLSVSKPGDNIDQKAVICYENQKTNILTHLFKTISSKRVIVFAASKAKVKELTRELRRHKYNVGEIHSDLEQTQRDQVLHQFRTARIDALIATDIVARGIDIDDITMVVNYDVPHEAEDYVHRIGRTARAGANGCAVTFVSEKEQRQFALIEKFLGKPVNNLTLPPDLGAQPQYNPKPSHKRTYKRTPKRTTKKGK
jgi:superfamily II DNA/RNA helicase